jgi:hypothetical protein
MQKKKYALEFVSGILYHQRPEVILASQNNTTHIYQCEGCKNIHSGIPYHGCVRLHMNMIFSGDTSIDRNAAYIIS